MVWGGMWRAVRLLAGFLAAGCSPLAAINGAVETEGLTISRAIAYGAGPRQALDVYRHAAAGAGPAPVVVFFYGGAWEYGDRGDYLFAAQALAERGFVTVVPDYRLYPAARFPAFVEDGAAAVRWVHDNIGAYG
ncbi:MAG TPA: alpha/beta hydrolase, partial [Alphaproteobacteria bacterium]|nr:alpha/beta hydrolase [Alphaproteobacteria bacterium]